MSVGVKNLDQRNRISSEKYHLERVLKKLQFYFPSLKHQSAIFKKFFENVRCRDHTNVSENM